MKGCQKHEKAPIDLETSFNQRLYFTRQAAAAQTQLLKHRLLKHC